MMRQKGIKLRVPEPCHEKWSEMSQSEKGRFCMSCQKEVVDFTTYSDEQILNYFANTSGKQCGRFHPMQLDKKIVPVKTLERPSAIKLFLASLLVFLGLREGIAQEKKKSEPVSQTTNNGSLKEVEQKRAKHSYPIKFEGTVVDSVSGEVLIGATVIIEGTGAGCSTDIDGHFSLIIPEKYEQDSVPIRVAFIGYESKRFYFTPTNAPKRIELVMTSEILGGGIVTVGVIEAEPFEKRMELLRVKTWLKSIGHW
jgi:hypothetical protein